MDLGHLISTKEAGGKRSLALPRDKCSQNLYFGLLFMKREKKMRDF